TQDVVMSDNRVTTPHRVDFRWGPNRGHGQGLEIVMVADDAAGASHSQGPNIEGIQSIALARDVRMHLELGSGTPFDEALLAGPDPQRVDPKSAGQPAAG